MLINKLRAETRKEHRSIEEKWFSKQLLNYPSLHFYQSYLSAWLDIYRAYGEIITVHYSARHLQLFTESIEQLKDDLNYLDSLFPSSSPKLLSLPILDDISGWGALYVFNGSKLGGIIIAKSLQQSPSFMGGTRFFQGVGQKTFSRWSTFLEELSILDELPERQHQSIIHAAKKTFLTIETHLETSLTSTTNQSFHTNSVVEQ